MPSSNLPRKLAHLTLLWLTCLGNKCPLKPIFCLVEVKKFCNDIGTNLRALEEGTPWSNKAELYNGLIKEAVRKTCANQILHCVFGITVLRGEPGSTILQLRMHSSFMDPLPTQLPLVMKVTFQTCVSMDGMNGVTSGIKLQHSLTTRKFWAEYLALPEELVMK